MPADTRVRKLNGAATKEVPMVVLASKYDQSRYFRAEELTEDKILRIKASPKKRSA